MQNDNDMVSETNLATEWLASTGYLLPENETEYKRFKTLFPNSVSLSGKEINPFDILNGKPFVRRAKKSQTIPFIYAEEHKLVAAIKKHSDTKDTSSDDSTDNTN